MVLSLLLIIILSLVFMVLYKVLFHVAFSLTLLACAFVIRNCHIQLLHPIKCMHTPQLLVWNKFNLNCYFVKNEGLIQRQWHVFENKIFFSIWNQGEGGVCVTVGQCKVFVLWLLILNLVFDIMKHGVFQSLES